MHDSCLRPTFQVVFTQIKSSGLRKTSLMCSVVLDYILNYELLFVIIVKKPWADPDSRSAYLESVTKVVLLLLLALRLHFVISTQVKVRLRVFSPLPSSDIIHLVGWCISTHHIRWLMFWTNGCERVEPWTRWGWRLAHTDVDTDETLPPHFHVTEAVQFFGFPLMQFISFLGLYWLVVLWLFYSFLLFIWKFIAIDKLKKNSDWKNTPNCCWILQLGFIFLQSPFLLIHLEKL